MLLLKYLCIVPYSVPHLISNHYTHAIVAAAHLQQDNPFLENCLVLEFGLIWKIPQRKHFNYYPFTIDFLQIAQL